MAVETPVFVPGVDMLLRSKRALLKEPGKPPVEPMPPRQARVVLGPGQKVVNDPPTGMNEPE